ncbi:hypothetical protein [Meiothermus sp. Pnk-1]|uniref:hypothetical protein n=1 Tax=Meiothermus sp. Pnk-1 TaxID=873128 RepID=UPI0018F17137|nr:hypothetical protein [Meiothermus sp. Pnk-1]
MLIDEQGQGVGAFTLEECGHSGRLLWLATWAAGRFGLGAEFVDGARLHDVGKLYVPRYDLLKRPLDEFEESVVRFHVLEYLEAEWPDC